MTEVVTADRTRVGTAQQMATRAAFFMAGLSMAAWAPLIPFTKARLNIGEGQLGALLLAMGTGSVVGMPIAGTLAGRYGCRTMILLSAILTAAMLPFMAAPASIGVLAIALFCFGVGIGTLDVTMNIHAVLVERESGRSMMSGFHGMYSVGGIFGAGTVIALISTGASPLGAAGAIVMTAVAILAATFTSFLPYGSDGDTPAFVVPHGRVLLLGCFCFVMFLAEGSVLDWSAVFLTTVRHVSEAHAGIAYVAFAVAMTICRLTGDSIVRILGPARVVLFGGLCAAAGFGLAIAVPSTIAAVIGFGLVGVGASNVVPVMFSAAGRQTAMPMNLAIAAITTLGYAGILTGPAAIGLFAHYWDLSIGLAVVAVMLLIVAVTSTRVKF